MSEKNNWYFTAPWEHTPIRRGDALGLRAGADYFANLLAPDLSNSTVDARWISVLSWCLQWSHIAWRNAGGKDLSQRDDQRARYAWLRPLELLWVDRTLASGQNTGQLRGRRSIERWIANDSLPNFAMSSDQFRRYRQVGSYGAYRVVLRIPGLTTGGDGWTLDETGLALAKLVNNQLPVGTKLKEIDFEKCTQWGHWSKDMHAEYWIKHGWSNWRLKPKKGWFPTPNDAISKELPDEERRLLKQVIFAKGSIRCISAEVLASATTANTHADLCDALANSTELATKMEPGSLASLHAFTCFADAAMDAMREVWNEINQDNMEQAPSIEKVAESENVTNKLALLRDVSLQWLNPPEHSTFPHAHIVTKLAESIRDAKTPIDQLCALRKHHHEQGGGRRWFREQAGRLVPLVRNTDIAATDYRFRLRPLARLAAQCGVANMDNVLKILLPQEPDEDEADLL